jgi:hypothetical protein
MRTHLKIWLCAALAATLALGLIAGSAVAEKKKTKIETILLIDQVDDSGYPPDVTIDGVLSLGHVGGDDITNPGVCLRKRTVKLRQTSDDLFAGRDKTRFGSWKITFDGTEIPSGDFKATVLKRKIVKKNKIIICKRDTKTFSAEY